MSITPEQEAAEFLQKIRSDKNITPRGQVLCGQALGRCLQLGWPKSALDSLEIIWWSVHDGNGNQILLPNRADMSSG